MSTTQDVFDEGLVYHDSTVLIRRRQLRPAARRCTGRVRGGQRREIASFMRRGAWSLFEAGIEACRVAIAKRRLGIADLVLCAIPDVVTLDARRRGDAARTRRSFDLHRDFGPALRAAQRTHIAGIAIDGLRRRD